MNKNGILMAFLCTLLAGCVTVAYEPALPMPERPKLHFFLCEPNVCLSQEDADKLAKYLDKLNAFDAARQRMIEQK